MNLAVKRLYAPLHEATTHGDVTVLRDQRYGPDERHRMDIYTRPRAAALRPVLVFAHGGGYVGGDKAAPNRFACENVLWWIALHGAIGVAMTYRLAPAHRWPSGAEDVGGAVAWVRDNASLLGADADRIFAMGHSAGATHVADHVARTINPGLAGALLIAGPYEPAPGGTGAAAYYGDDKTRYLEMSSLAGVARSACPLLIAISELDPAPMELQSARLFAAVTTARNQAPRFVRLSGHNHFSLLEHLGAHDSALSAEILDFLGLA